MSAVIQSEHLPVGKQYSRFISLIVYRKQDARCQEYPCLIFAGRNDVLCLLFAVRIVLCSLCCRDSPMKNAGNDQCLLFAQLGMLDEAVKQQ